MSDYGELVITRQEDGSITGRLFGRGVILAAAELLQAAGVELAAGAGFDIWSYRLTLVGPAPQGGGLWEVRVSEIEPEGPEVVE